MSGAGLATTRLPHGTNSKTTTYQNIPNSVKRILLIATSLCGLALSSQGALIAHYTFDEDPGAAFAVDTLGGTSGAVGLSVNTGLLGISGNAYEFTDTTTQAGIVDMGNASFFAGPTGLNASTQLTFSVWVSTIDSDANRNTVLYAGSDTVTNSYIDLGVSGENGAQTVPTNPSVDGAASARNRPVGASGAQATGLFSSPTTVDDGLWHHLAMTIDRSPGGTLKLYVDGVLSGTQNLTTLAFPAFNNFEIGRLGRFNGSFAPTDYYGGLVDDVQVYNVALAPSDIAFLHDNPGLAVVPEPSTLALAGLGLLAITGRRKRA